MRETLAWLEHALVEQTEKQTAENRPLDIRQQKVDFVNQPQPDNGWTPIHFAVYQNYVEIVRLLIQEGAHVNVITKDGWTPLMIAAHRGLFESKLTLGSGCRVGGKRRRKTRRMVAIANLEKGRYRKMESILAF